MSSKHVDRLSMLPDEIVSHILSLMPTKYAVRTSILSKRWRYSWMFITNLVFDDTEDRSTNFVNRVLKFCKTSQVNLVRLHFRHSTYGYKLSVCVSKWIDKVVKLNVRELDLCHLHTLPLNLLTCKTLTKLRLDNLSYDYYFYGSSCPHTTVNLPCLRTLDIVGSTNPFLDVIKLIDGCPLLESLSLEVTRHNDEEDYVFNIPTLKRLKLKWLQYCPTTPINKVVLRVPNLEYLFVSGELCSSFVMEDVSSLVEACVSSSFYCFLQLWDELMKGLSGVKSLSIQHILFTPTLAIFPNLKHLEIKSFRHYGKLFQILESSPELKHLRIEKDQLLNGSCWSEPKFVPACMLTNLTTIKFLNCNGYLNYDKRFLKYILRNAKVLKTVTITCECLMVKEESRFCAELLKLPRASRGCEIHFHGNRCS